jgi:hypothetical protein
MRRTRRHLTAHPSLTIILCGTSGCAASSPASTPTAPATSVDSSAGSSNVDSDDTGGPGAKDDENAGLDEKPGGEPAPDGKPGLGPEPAPNPDLRLPDFVLWSPPECSVVPNGQLDGSDGPTLFVAMRNSEPGRWSKLVSFELKSELLPLPCR